MTLSTHAPRQAEPVDPKVLRNVCGHFVTGVTVITSEENGLLVGTTVNSFTSVSLDPPLVLFCLHKGSKLRAVVNESRMFAVNFLAGRQQGLAWAFAGRGNGMIEDVVHHRSTAGMPILSESLAFLACRLVSEFDGGDHTIFVGEVVEVGVPREGTDPLIFFRGSLSALAEETDGVHPIWDG
jgi:3-hydroxy-9,10-secoandrosta-1,3,5(10)-triene-9,17-dione monooxygenase reductase component